MAIENYGDLARFPREIRDQIYGYYFTVAREAVIKRELSRLKEGIILYAPGSDKGLLTVSKPIYRETFPLWKRKVKRRNLCRVFGDIVCGQLPAAHVFMTAPAGSIPRLPQIGPRNLIYRSHRWIHQPETPHERQVSVVFPNLQFFFGQADMDTHRLIKVARSVLEIRYLTSFTIVILDPSWPLSIPGQEVWYERLHKGITRRTLAKAREEKAKQIAEQIARIICTWQHLVKSVTLVFGNCHYGHDFRDKQALEDIVRIVQKMVIEVGLRF